MSISWAFLPSIIAINLNLLNRFLVRNPRTIAVNRVITRAAVLRFGSDSGNFINYSISSILLEPLLTELKQKSNCQMSSGMSGSLLSLLKQAGVDPKGLDTLGGFASILASQSQGAANGY